MYIHVYVCIYQTCGNGLQIPHGQDIHVSQQLSSELLLIECHYDHSVTHHGFNKPVFHKKAQVLLQEIHVHVHVSDVIM